MTNVVLAPARFYHKCDSKMIYSLWSSQSFVHAYVVQTNTFAYLLTIVYSTQ